MSDLIKLKELVFESDNKACFIERERILRRLETDILGKLRRSTVSELRTLPDISEGIENRLFSAAKSATTLEELYSLIKTKRYTLARVRRLVLSAYLDLKADYLKVSRTALSYRMEQLGLLDNNRLVVEAENRKKGVA